MKTLKILLVIGLVAGAGGLGFIYSGLYPMGADDPHLRPVYWALDTMRERSVAVRASNIEVPPLDDPEMLLAGGADYNDMCAGCHLKPGKKSSEMSAGLYPQPPNLSLGADGHAGHEGGHGEVNTSAARQFWIIKHGIKASGMAAFGPTHDDQRIWAMVAFLQKLPTIDAAQYQILTARRDGDGGAMKGMDPGSASTAAAEQNGAGQHGETGGSAMPDSHAGMAAKQNDKQASEGARSDSPQAAVDAFQAALKSGNAGAVKKWLTPDVLIYEGGGAERSLAEYAGHHLAADMAFMKSARVEVLKRASGEDGNTAWITTESRIRGESSKGKPLDVASTESALLRKSSEGWRIIHIHWSSSDFTAAP
ncbi:MAG: nuclear transport factor 2 family protein [Pseudomonadota bacterium]